MTKLIVAFRSFAKAPKACNSKEFVNYDIFIPYYYQFTQQISTLLLINVLNGLYPSPSIIRVIKSSKTIQKGHMACIGKQKNTYMVLVEKPEDRVDEIILKLILNKMGRRGLHLARDREKRWSLVNMVINLRAP
jgi:hypothetical protein